MNPGRLLRIYTIYEFEGAPQDSPRRTKERQCVDLFIEPGLQAYAGIPRKRFSHARNWKENIKEYSTPFSEKGIQLSGIFIFMAILGTLNDMECWCDLLP